MMQKHAKAFQLAKTLVCLVIVPLHHRAVIPSGAIDEERHHADNVNFIQRLTFNRVAVIGDECLTQQLCELRMTMELEQ